MPLNKRCYNLCGLQDDDEWIVGSMLVILLLFLAIIISMDGHTTLEVFKGQGAMLCSFQHSIGF